ncbi:spore coat protein I/spore coat-associated protein S [Bacillus oleivorans]|uniref:Spore coat protein I/spore coat-associated protein S n=1 Tax=Bacillus oleivorans TaxID=1448271 RepID=A0A285D435_9BACI|nr:CotS family spore coat protein [Bacillus oleivorans]SNX74048.1 spore coat protein I/spore coat-associated protein S [Bacillus oleivorans]
MDTVFSDVVKDVISQYPLKVETIYLLSYKGKKAVWSIATDQGEVIMKKLPMIENDIKFMIHAIDYLRNGGIYTPGVFKTNSGEGYVEHEGEYFVVFEAVYGRNPDYEIEEDMRMIMRGMAAFHKASKGIESPTGEFPSFLLLESKEEMERRYQKLVNWKEEKSKKSEKNAIDKLFLKYVDTCLEQAEKAIAMLANPYFEQWVEETKINKTLCHQDYASGNLVIGNDNNLYVFDMDSLTVELPVRDIRKILNKVMKKETAWNLEKFKNMMKYYQEVNPLTKEQYQILAADLQFPHLFYGQVSKYYEGRDAKWPLRKHFDRIKDMTATELSKDAVLQSFLSQLDEVISHGA